MDQPYHIGLLCLTHLLISADGTIDDEEKKALGLIVEKERIPLQVFHQFLSSASTLKERDLFQRGIDALNCCSDDEKLRVFVTLYKLAEVDGRVHLKEIKLLLYSLRLAQIDFELVANRAINTPPLI